MTGVAPIIDIRDLTVTFTDGRKPVRAVSGVDLAVAEGEVLGLQDEAGSGKSVTLRSLLHLHPKKKTRIAGSMTAAGADVMSLSDGALAEAGVAVVGLEPSCLLTLRDEALAMGLGELARIVAGQALLFEEFLAREAKAGRFAPSFRPLDKPVLLHGHCHQKAFGAVAPVMDVLRLIPGCKPELIESSCCGMAGSFGYEAGHYDVSMQMAEAALLPAVRANPDAIVVADGTSCRHQIADGAQRQAIHVARLLEALLDG